MRRLHAEPPALLGPVTGPPAGDPPWRPVAASDALAEPPSRCGEWVCMAYARVTLASAGPVALGPALDDGARLRLTAAGWPVVDTPVDAWEARRAFWPTLDGLQTLGLGAGAPRPSLVLVGEVEPSGAGLPFLARSGVWLLRALRELGHDELTVYLTNACRGRRVLTRQLAGLEEVLARYEPTWVALGVAAGRALTAAHVRHVGHDHPAHARRFAYAAGPQGYAAALAAAGVPLGRWRGAANPGGEVLPVVPIAAAPDLVDQLGLPRSVAHRRAAVVGDPGEQIARAKQREARRMYVAGEVDTLADAARRTGSSYDHLRDTAREEEWAAQRNAHAAEVERRTLDKLVEAESQAIVAARRLAGNALARALQAIDRTLADGSYAPRARDAESLAKTYALLAGRGDAAGDAELERLRKLHPVDQVRECARVLREQWGLDVLGEPPAGLAS